MDKIRIEIIPSTEMDYQLKKDINEWLISEFIEDDDNTTWSDVDWHILGWFDDQLISHLDILERIVNVDEVKILIAGIGGVVTKYEWRGKGIASHLMRKTQQFLAQKLSVEYGLLMCGQDRTSFYQGLGWKIVENQLEYDQPTGKEIFDDHVMVYPIKHNDFPSGKIDVHGYPW